MTYLSASSSFPLAEVLRLLIKRFGALGHNRLRPPIENPSLELHPDGTWRGHPVPPDYVVGVVEAPVVPDVDLVEELERTRVLALATNS